MNRTALALALSLAAACGRKEPPAAAGPGPSPATATPGTAAVPATAPPPAPSGVRLADAEPVSFAPRVEATGTLKARESSLLGFSIAGTLRSVPVRRGQAVAEGAPLAQLDADVARAAVAQAEAGLAAAQAQARLAADALERSTRMRSQESISESAFVQAEAQRDLTRAQARAADATLRQAQVALEKHTIKAPFAGTVTRVPDGTGIAVAAGQVLLALEATRLLTLDTSLTQDEAVGLRAGDAVEVVVPETGARASGATVRLVLPSVDASTGRVPVEVAVPNADGRLLAHAFARATFPTGKPRPAWKVPAASLVQRDGAFAVWGAGADGKARAVPVRILGQAADGAVVDPGAGGWPAGVRVVAAPPLGIAEGTRVAEGTP
jgi:RND family efflux transporter MFP subunit